MNDLVEFGLLLKSHGAERAKELISQRYSPLGDQKPWLVLYDKREPAPPPRPPRGRKSKTNAHLQAFLKEGPTDYAAYEPLNRLWRGYMHAALGGGGDLANKVLTADWSGAEIEVIRAKSPGFLGKRGILVWEARSILFIVTRGNKLIKVPKRGCVFALHGLPKEVRLVGDRLLCRSAERTTRKFKPHNVADIQALLAPAGGAPQ